MLFAASVALAQQPGPDLMEKPPEELIKVEVASVYGASKYLQKVTEAPSAVTIVTDEEIQKYGYQTLADILRSVRGFYVTYDRNYSYVGVRGFARPGDYNSRILLLVDGHRVNENIYDGGYVGTEFSVDVDLIERVEIIRGPSSSLYGTNAFFAVVNVITKRGRDVMGLEVSSEAASFDTYKNRFSFGSKWDNGAELLLSGTVYNSHGRRRLFFQEFDDQATNNGIAENADGDRSQSLLANLSFKNFTLQGSLVSRKKQIPTASFGTIFNDPRAHTIDTHGYLDLTYSRTFGREWGAMARLYSDRYIYVGRYPLSTSDPTQPTVNNEDFALGSWWGGELQLNKKLYRRHQLTGGAEYKDNVRQRQVNYDADPYVRYADTRPKTNNFALYLQDEFTVRENLTLSAGVRYDHYSTFGRTVNPRLGLIYHPFSKTALKLLYGRAFRAPNAYELFYSTPFATPNPNLEPEKIGTSEIVWEQYLGDRFRLSAAGYYYRLNNLISQQADPVTGAITLRNAETIRAKGMEFEAEAKLASGFESRVSYTFQQVTNRMTGELLTNSPRHLGKLNLSVPVAKNKVFASFDLQYVSLRRTLANLPSRDARAYWLPTFTLFSPKLMNGLDVSFSINNLFDQKYGYPGGEEHQQNIIVQDGRTWRLKLTYRFNLTR
ncbi:MAG TPA: TonB-dependent receptor [Pyrinomonadaceae bacterium]|nr:TonB-dependent receptor [Pyrinomonadaceae bacterium]